MEMLTLRTEVTVRKMIQEIILFLFYQHNLMLLRLCITSRTLQTFRYSYIYCVFIYAGRTQPKK